MKGTLLPTLALSVNTAHKSFCGPNKIHASYLMSAPLSLQIDYIIICLFLFKGLLYLVFALEEMNKFIPCPLKSFIALNLEKYKYSQ